MPAIVWITADTKTTEIQTVRARQANSRSEDFSTDARRVTGTISQPIFGPNSWIARIGSFVTITLIAVALMALQLSFLGKALLFQLPSYALIGFTTLLACLALPGKTSFSRTCVGATMVFAGYVCLRALTSPANYFARSDLYCVLAALTLYLLIATTIVSPSRRFGLLVLLLALGVYHILVGLVQFGVGENFLGLPFLAKFEVTKRASGFYRNPDHLAGLLEVLGVLALSITCWARRPKLVKVMFGSLGFICYVGLAMTASRGGYLSATASICTFLILSAIVLKSGLDPEFKTYRRVTIIIAIVALLGGAVAVEQSSNIRQRVREIVSPDQTRLDLWRASLEQWKLNPVFGTGGGTYRFYGREFRSAQMQSDPVFVHNDYLHLLCEYGLVGMGCFAFFAAAHLRRGWRNFAHYGANRIARGTLASSDRLALTIGALSAIAAYVVHSAVDFNLHVPANALVFALVFGVLANPGRDRNSAESPVPVRFGVRFAIVLLAAMLCVRCGWLLPGEYFAERSRVALMNEEPLLAVAFANKALIYEQDNPNIYFYLGRAWGALGDEKPQSEERSTYYEQALVAFNKARQLVPLEQAYPLDMAFAYDQLGRFGEAEWMFGLARERDPRSETIANLYRAHLEVWQHAGHLAADFLKSAP